MPSYISPSDTLSAPASIIAILLSVEATVTAILDFALCSLLGLITKLPSTSPTDTPEIGPFQGISEMERAIDVPTIAVISGEQLGSTDITVQITETSFLISLGKRGLMGLSITLETSIAFSDGLPSLLRYEPGIFPTA